MRGWATRSYRISRWFSASAGTQDFGCDCGGPGGISPKNFSTFAFAASGVISPEITTIALEGPYQVLNQSCTSAIFAALRSSIDPMTVCPYG